MTPAAAPRSAHDWLPRLEAMPLVLSDARPLQDFLARDTKLGQGGVEISLGPS